MEQSLAPLLSQISNLQDEIRENKKSFLTDFAEFKKNNQSDLQDINQLLKLRVSAQKVEDLFKSLDVKLTKLIA